MTTPRKADLEVAYGATSYFVDGPGGRFAIRVGRASPEADALATQCHVSTWAYVTAYNAGSVPTSAAQNQAWQRELEQTVAAAGFRFLHGEGKGDDGAWPAEPSLLILGAGEADAAALGRRFGQAAIVFGQRNEAARLVWIDARGTETVDGPDGFP